jgi:hypothetical protein
MNHYDVMVMGLRNGPTKREPTGEILSEKSLPQWSVSIRARPERFELPACCSGGLPAQEINNLAGAIRIVTECYTTNVYASLRRVLYRCVPLSRVWWWAQNWAHFPAQAEPVLPVY